jgi:hypothetical protein
MITLLKKTVRRRTTEVYQTWGPRSIRNKTMVVAPEAGDIIAVKLLACRKVYRLPIRAVMSVAIAADAEATRRAKIAARIAKKKGGKR